MLRIGVLGSTRGTNLLSLFNVIDAGNLTAEVAVVVSNKSEALILEKARERGVVAEFVCSKGLDRVEYDLQISALLETHKVDLVVLIGYMRILSSQFVDFWQGRIINVHPSLLPAFAGLMDLAVHQAVLDDYANLSNYQVYACGAPIVIESAKRDFVAKSHLPADEFYADSFTSEADLAKN